MERDVVESLGSIPLLIYIYIYSLIRNKIVFLLFSIKLHVEKHACWNLYLEIKEDVSFQSSFQRKRSYDF